MDKHSLDIIGQLDIEGRLKGHFPILFELLNNTRVDWKQVEKVFTRKHFQHMATMARKGHPIQVEASFFNVVSSAIKGERQAILLLNYIQKLFEELTDRLDDAEKPLIVPNIYGMLTNIDMKYQNFLGELSVLNLMKRNHEVILLATEAPLVPKQPKGTMIDFCFRNLATNKISLVEVVNLHLSAANTSSDAIIERLLDQKIRGKLLATGIEKHKHFQLVPVAWGRYTEIQTVLSYYLRCKPKFENTTVPVGYVPFTTPDGTMVHKFGTIDTLFENALIPPAE